MTIDKINKMKQYMDYIETYNGCLNDMITDVINKDAVCHENDIIIMNNIEYKVNGVHLNKVTFKLEYYFSRTSDCVLHCFGEDELSFVHIVK